MYGFEVEPETGKVKPKGDIFFGGEYVIKDGPSYILIQQKQTETTQEKLNATSERAAKIEIGRKYPNMKGRIYIKTRDEVQIKRKEQAEQVSEESKK